MKRKMKAVPGEGIACDFGFSCAALVFRKSWLPGDLIDYSVKWFDSVEEASLWLDSEGIRNFVVPTGKLDLIALRSSGEIFDPVAGKPRKPRSSKRRGR